jgi:hypothetical protein
MPSYHLPDGCCHLCIDYDQASEISDISSIGDQNPYDEWDNKSFDYPPENQEHSNWREDSMSYEPDDLERKPVNRHLYFSDAGDEITREEYLRQEEWSFTLSSSLKMVARHPRVLISYFRFIDSLNEVANEDEKIYLNPISASDVLRVLSHPSIQDAIPEFADEILYLIQRLNELIV